MRSNDCLAKTGLLFARFGKCTGEWNPSTRQIGYRHGVRVPADFQAGCARKRSEHFDQIFPGREERLAGFKKRWIKSFDFAAGTVVLE